MQQKAGVGLLPVGRGRDMKILTLTQSQDSALGESPHLSLIRTSTANSEHTRETQVAAAARYIQTTEQSTTRAGYFEHKRDPLKNAHTFALSPVEYASTVRLMWPQAASDWPDWQDYNEIYKVVRATAVPNYMEARLPVHSGLNIHSWRRLLKGFPDEQLVEFLNFGWPLDFTAPQPPVPSYTNHETNEAFLQHIGRFLEEELTQKAMLGPFCAPPFSPWVQVSPMLTRPKKDSEKRRVIVNLSYPEGRSVNDGITKAWYQGNPFEFKLPSITDLLKRVIIAGRGAYLWSADLARAYRQLRVCPLSTPLLGLFYNNSFYIDLAPPFGCRMSAMACARTTAAVVWLLEQHGHELLCYLDDFVGVAKRLLPANSTFTAIMNLAVALGLDMAVAKCIAPTTVLTWLGYTVDTISMTVTVREEKVAEALEECKQWFGKKQTSRKELRSLFGKLKHVTSCIPAASRFLNRILQALRDAPLTGFIPTPPDVLKDLHWFMCCAKQLNGVTLLPPPTLEIWEIECDSSLTGGGAFSKTTFFTEQYSSEYVKHTKNIAHLEALNLLHAFKFLTPPNASRYLIIVNTDNQASQVVLDSGKGKDSILTACARQLWLMAAILSSEVKVVYKPGNTIVLADALSRAHTSHKLNVLAEVKCKELNLVRIKIVHNFDILNPDL